MYTALAEMIMLPNDKKKNFVRNLFGVADQETRHQDLVKQESFFEDSTRLFIEKWNFDPVTEKSTAGGKYDWELVVSTENIPAFYTKKYVHVSDNSRKPSRITGRTSAAKRKLNYSDFETDNKAEVVSTDSNLNNTRVPSKGETVTLSAGSDSISKPSVPCATELPFGLRSCSNPELVEMVSSEFVTPPPQSKQSYITDFMPAKKRRQNSDQKNTQHRPS
ncbi:hypothetical protein BgiBS90_026364 [Biomphalaria glabrata]|uniref:Cyclin-dependent kinase inhibitor domain-containing protein n=1 Tax=Biomphalaria glabrata TaxID=6526 RepID=A0A2C9LG44_BIOGL|nr:hypothetical protein BgiBS90_026364 [Biomphalaria glabrata]